MRKMRRWTPTRSCRTCRSGLPLICAPAVAPLPPPPSFSSTTCTLHAADGARADDDLFAVREEDERGSDAGDVYELIGRLRGDGTGDGLIQAGDGELATVEPGSLHDAVAGERIVQIRLEQLLDLDRVGARLAQIGRGLKRARAGADGEILRIQHDTGQQRLRLERPDVALADRVLQKLRYKLRRGGCIRLVQIEDRLLDIIRSPAVVVDDRDAGNGLEQRACTRPAPAGWCRRR